MTPEQLQQAIDLIEKYKGKITEGEWESIYLEIEQFLDSSYCEYVVRINGEKGTLIDTALQSEAPTLLALLDVAVDENRKLVKYMKEQLLPHVAECQSEAKAFREQNAELKKRIKELEGKR